MPDSVRCNLSTFRPKRALRSMEALVGAPRKSCKYPPHLILFLACILYAVLLAEKSCTHSHFSALEDQQLRSHLPRTYQFTEFLCAWSCRKKFCTQTFSCVSMCVLSDGEPTTSSQAKTLVDKGQAVVNFLRPRAKTTPIPSP